MTEPVPWVKFGCIRDKPDTRDYRWTITREAVLATPPSADLRKYDTPILNQGDLGSCTAHAAVAVFEWLQNLRKGEHFDGSRMFIYKESRDLDGWSGDEGATIRSTAKALHDEGVPPESLWGYDASLLDVEAPEAVHKAAERATATNYWRLDSTYGGMATLTNLKDAVGNKGLPVMMGFVCYDSIFYTGSDGMIPLPRENEPEAGGHAVAIMGYDDAKSALLIKNSWGTGWGAQGYGWLPYGYVLKDLVWDCWVIAEESIVPGPSPEPEPTDKTCCQEILDFLSGLFKR